MAARPGRSCSGVKVLVLGVEAFVLRRRVARRLDATARRLDERTGSGSGGRLDP
jgi:hypothetical protein